MTKDECLNIIKENDKHMAMINFLDPFLTNLELIVSEEYPDTLFFKQNNEILFEFDYNSENKYFWVDYSKIWVVFETKFGLNYNEIQAFIKYQVEKGIKIGDITPHVEMKAVRRLVEKGIKIGDITPWKVTLTALERWKKVSKLGI